MLFSSAGKFLFLLIISYDIWLIGGFTGFVPIFFITDEEDIFMFPQ